MRSFSRPVLGALVLALLIGVTFPVASATITISSNTTVGSTTDCNNIGGTPSGETCFVGSLTIDPGVTLSVTNGWNLDPDGEVMVNGTLAVIAGDSGGLSMLPNGYILDYGNVTVSTSNTLLYLNSGTSMEVYGVLLVSNGGHVNGPGPVYAECGSTVTGSGSVDEGVTGACAPVENVACNPTPATEYDAATCTATVQGDEPPTGTVSWTNTGTGSFNSTTCSLWQSNSTAGECTVTYTPTAASGESVTGGYGGDTVYASDSASFNLTIEAPPALDVSAPQSTPDALDQGQTSTVSATFGGGVPSYTCQWFEEAPGSSSYVDLGASSSCTSPADTDFVTSASTLVGVWQLEVQVTDSVATSTNSSAAQVDVYSALVAGAITPGSPNDRSGNPVTLTAHPSGGDGDYSYQWYAASGCSSSAIADSNSSTHETGALSMDVTYSYSVTDSAPVPVTVCSPGDTVTVITPPPPSSLPPVIPTTLTFYFNVQGVEPLVGHWVSTQDGTVTYNVPGYNPSTDVMPYTISACYDSTNDLILVSGFYSVGPGSNSTELVVSNWSSIYTNPAGWPSEPACT